ncbi:Aste57867_22914 [Aphanomyces stellatus]|uniref:Aste57867_22914 protein n=1 Tax=Aphanomyces stellatus TaxID=120398 RepID=A0A485LR09_9STRA|nr:hypothetical protein As57867_022843 [Aphanomyces stellatus]VFT99564.1 Aste57867_22914 [Aphanomyces stellatus]
MDAASLDEVYPNRVVAWRVVEPDIRDGIDDGFRPLPPADDLVCEECEKRQAVYRCLDCRETLCHNCTNALHIIPAMADHLIRHLEDGDPGFVADVRHAPTLHVAPPPTLPALHVHPLRWGDHVTFRDPDIAPGLLFGIVVDGDAPRRGADNVQYVRVLWIRGVLPLPNDTFQAVLTLPRPYWPVRIHEYVRMYHAFRAVVLAERRARQIWRREKYAGRLRKVREWKHFPATNALLAEILADVDAHLDPVMDAHMDHDVFLASVGHPPLKDEGDETEVETDAPYLPLSRVRVLLLHVESLTSPTVLRHRHLRHVIGHMIDLYVGYAWKAFQRNMHEARQQERAALEQTTATQIQTWFRILYARQREQRLASGRASGLDAMEALRRFKARQEAVVMMDVLWRKTLHRLQRNSLRRMKAVADALHVNVPEQEAPWHPAWGVRLLKLPRAYAHMKSDGGLAVEDITKYKQFRQNHSGPTAVSYWIIRERVLMGQYPRGQAFPDKRAKRVAARADSITCLLLEEIGTFVCLLEHDEVDALEATLGADDRVPPASPSDKTRRHADAPRFHWHATVQFRHAKLKQELENAARAAEKYVAMAAKTLDQLTQRGDDDAFVLDLAAKKKTLSENNYQQALANLNRLRPLSFLHLPIPHNCALTDSDLRRHLHDLEARLRAGENLYIFSGEGRGRAGLVGALLLGRLYGLTPQQALERQQRCHDCQRAVASLPSTRLISSPEEQTQINMVHQLLGITDTIYARVLTTGPDEAYRVARTQRRGVGVQQYATTGGFMVDAFPSRDAIDAERRAAALANRIAKKEIRAMQLRWRRRRQATETRAMVVADDESAHMPPPPVDVEAQVRALLTEMVLWLDQLPELHTLVSQEDKDESSLPRDPHGGDVELMDDSANAMPDPDMQDIRPASDNTNEGLRQGEESPA